MSDLTLPKEKTAILVMDCQNDIVHEDGKFGGHPDRRGHAQAH